MAEPLFTALLLDGDGGATSLDPGAVAAWRPEDGVLWMQFHGTGEEARRFLEGEGQLEPTSVDALVADDPRPRSLVIDDRLLLTLRAANVNPGADPEDMVSLRTRVGPHKIITLRNRKVFALADLQQELMAGRGPRDSAEFLVDLIDRLLVRIVEVTDGIDEQVDALEEAVVEGETRDLRPRIAGVRRSSIALRRYLAPQRDGIQRLHGETLSWIGDSQRARLRDDADRLTRVIEDLDSARDRAAVTQEELASRTAEQTNRIMYVIAIVSVIFLPLGFATGLLGINVGGMPGVESDLAFWAVVGGLGLFLAIELAMLKLLRWI